MLRMGVLCINRSIDSWQMPISSLTWHQILSMLIILSSCLLCCVFIVTCFKIREHRLLPAVQWFFFLWLSQFELIVALYSFNCFDWSMEEVGINKKLWNGDRVDPKTVERRKMGAVCSPCPLNFFHYSCTTSLICACAAALHCRLREVSVYLPMRTHYVLFNCITTRG